jgi:DNA-binding LytR/AlgR family response regulator
MSPATALLADDEPLLRAELRERLGRVWPALHIVGEAADGREAVEQALRLRPDVVFLDISMPRLDGLAAAQQLRQQGYAGELVFVTAYDAHALAAFERRAADYLVKPLDEARLHDTVARLAPRLAAPAPAVPEASAEWIAALRESLERSLQDSIERSVQQALAARDAAAPAPAAATAERLRWLRATRGNELHLIAVEDVACFRAVTGYTQLLTRDGEHLITETLKQLSAALDPAVFVQVHRSAIVNLRFVAGMRRVRPGSYVVDLRHGLGEVAATRSLADLIPAP